MYGVDTLSCPQSKPVVCTDFDPSQTRHKTHLTSFFADGTTEGTSIRVGFSHCVSRPGLCKGVSPVETERRILKNPQIKLLISSETFRRIQTSPSHNSNSGRKFDSEDHSETVVLLVYRLVPTRTPCLLCVTSVRTQYKGMSAKNVSFPRNKKVTKELSRTLIYFVKPRGTLVLGSEEERHGPGTQPLRPRHPR